MAHAEAQELFGRPVVSLELVSPHYYHLDTALAVLSSTADDPQIAYYPPAFSAGSRAVLEQLFPDAIHATSDDARALGLNAVSDGYNVVVAPGAVDLAAALTERGYNPIAVDTSELLKGGGGAKCCTLEIRARAMTLGTGVATVVRPRRPRPSSRTTTTRCPSRSSTGSGPG